MVRSISSPVRNVNNLDPVVKPNRIRDSIYTCIKSLFTHLFDTENVAYMHLCQRQTYQKLVPVSGTCVMQSGTSFLLGPDSGNRQNMFHSVLESGNHVTLIMTSDWSLSHCHLRTGRWRTAKQTQMQTLCCC